MARCFITRRHKWFIVLFAATVVSVGLLFTASCQKYDLLKLKQIGFNESKEAIPGLATSQFFLLPFCKKSMIWGANKSGK